MTETVCPVCTATQPDGLLCHACTTRLEQALGDVRWIVTELDTTLSKQARIGTPAKGGLAREKSALHLGAMEAADNLGNVLTTWLRDIGGELAAPKRRIYRMATSPYRGPFCMECEHPSCDRMRFYDTEAESPMAIRVAAALLSSVPEIRRHPAVVELMDEITDAVEQARRAVDRPADRMYLGRCLVELAPVYVGDPEPDYCQAELWSRPDAHEVQCRLCMTEHPVAERRAWLLLRAADMLTTVKEASRYLGDVGGIAVTESSVRGLIHRQRLAYRPGTTTFRLGDLLEVLTDMRAKEAAA